MDMFIGFESLKAHQCEKTPYWRLFALEEPNGLDDQNTLILAI